MNAGSKRTRAIELRLTAMQAEIDALKAAVYGPVANSGGGPGSEDNGSGDPPPSGGGPGSEDNGGGPG